MGIETTRMKEIWAKRKKEKFERKRERGIEE